MSTKVLGVDVILSAGGQTIGAQRDASLRIDAREIDVSDKTTGGWDVFLVGNRSWSIDCEAVTLTSNAGQDAIEQAALNGTPITVAFTFGAKAVYSGSAMVVSFEMSGPKDDVSIMRISLKGATALVRA